MFGKNYIPYYIATLLLIAACTIFALLFRHLIDPVNLVMIYLVGVVFIGARYGRLPSMLASLLSVSSFNFFFVEPYYSFNIHDEGYYITLIFMLAASLIVSSVAAKLKLQSASVERQNIELQALYQAASALTSCREHILIAATAARHIENALNFKASIWLPDTNGKLCQVEPHESTSLENDAAAWAYSHSEPCGKYTQTLPSANFYYLPLIAHEKTVGVLGLALEQGVLNNPIIAAYSSLIASAIARADATETAEQQFMEAEREKLRNTLLTAVGHDLRTPLASITGAASALCSQSQLSAQTKSLAESIYNEASRLNKLVRNLLDVTRMESGALSLNRQPYFFHELIGSALQLCKAGIGNHHVSLQVEKDLPLLNIDGVLIEQVLINLLENASRYSPDGGNININAIQTAYAVEISITDSGIGIQPGSEYTIFERYKRLSEKKTEGMGLGLAICKGIVEAHGGNIWVRNCIEGGATFTFNLPFQFNKIPLDSENS
jgi:two-component system sensor histidine kinase KdpD